MRRIVLFLIALALAAPAAAGTSPPGVNLRWDQCYADGGAANRSFACDTNSGTDRLAMSVEVASALPRVISIEWNVALGTAAPFVPAWWTMFTPGTCRPTALTYTAFPPAGSTHCPAWGGAGTLGAIGSYSFLSGTTVLLRGVAAVDLINAHDLAPGVEYSLGTLNISHVKTSLPGACPGCLDPVCILFSDVRITSLNSAGNPSVETRLTHAANWSGSAIVGWQNGYVAGSQPPGFNGAGDFVPAIITNCVAYSTTATRPNTWGAVKSLYR